MTYVEKIKIEQIEILDDNDKMKIEDDLRSENYLDNYYNPIQKDLDNFLEKNAIDIDDLIEDKSLILLDDEKQKQFPKSNNLFSKFLQNVITKEPEKKENNFQKFLGKSQKKKISFSKIKAKILNKNTEAEKEKVMANEIENEKRKIINEVKDDYKIDESLNESKNHKVSEDLLKEIKSEKENILTSLFKTKKKEDEEANKKVSRTMNIFSSHVDNYDEDKELKLGKKEEYSNETTKFNLKEEKENKESEEIYDNHLEEKKNIIKIKTIEEKIGPALSAKLIAIIMILLISLPIMNSEYVNLFIFNPDESAAFFFIVNSITKLIDNSNGDPKYLSGLFHFYNLALQSSEIQDSFEDEEYYSEPYLYYFDLSSYKPYINLYDKYINDTSYNMYLPNKTYFHFDYEKVVNERRSALNYDLKIYEYDDNSTIVLMFNRNSLQITSTTLNLLKTATVSIFIICGVLIFNHDITVYVAKPIDKVLKRLKYYLNNMDSLIDESPPEEIALEINRSKTMKKRTSFFASKIPKYQDSAIKNPKSQIQSIDIDQNIKVLINLASMTIGTQSKIFLIVSFKCNNEV